MKFIELIKSLILSVLAIALAKWFQYSTINLIKVRGHVFPKPRGSGSSRYYLEIAQYALGVFERRSLLLVKRYLRRNLTTIDIGANVGIWTSFLANELGETSIIHAFEPNPGAIKFLKNLVRMNSLENIKLHELALSNSEGEVQLHLNNLEDADVYASMQPGRTTNYIQVQSNTLDKSLQLLGSDLEIGFIKIDVEGFELEVLQGSEKTLRRHKPDICLEVNMFSWATRKVSLLSLEKLLSGFGYKIYEEKSTPSGLTLNEIKSLAQLADPVSNIHCFSVERVNILQSQKLIDLKAGI